MRFVRQFPWEAFTWAAGLSILALTPAQEAVHFTICPLALAGIDWCPGCGLGRAVSFLFHGQFLNSLQAHPLGIFAVIVLSFRIVSLLKKYITPHGKSY